ncbi:MULTISPECIES: ABC transporter ATP-binding protein [Rodentibacter]|uniref:ABC transporter ATP-binding protein n=1 Tax=Rodentibacter TaxID=1960084 RepID=UPI001CFD2CCB|nr:ABC transporter ATP-binding protein [Rodentibacter sp. JRC1]GJI56174.1 ABC transporter [Rodentibacter sp. JRC1]
MIEINNLTLPYALKNLSCHIPQGKLVGVMGANGSGKSTLLKAIAGIIHPISGQILFGNRNLAEMSAKEKSEQLAYFAQQTDIHWNLTVREVIALGLLSPLSEVKEQEKVRSISERFSITHLLDKPFLQLSGGEKARVQLARCCIKNAPLLLADEPIAPLDPYYQIDMMEQLKALTPEKTCLIAIHHLSLAYRFCDEIVLLEQGKLIAAGQTQEIITSANLVTAFSVQAEIDRTQGRIRNVDKWQK